MQRRFRFRLARLLRVREIAEQAARARWGEAQAELRSAQDEHARAVGARESAERDLLTARTSGHLDASETLLGERLLARLTAAIADARETVLTLTERCDRLQAAWRERERDRKALVELEERARAAHGVALAALESAEMDEIAGMRSARQDRAAKKAEKRSSPAPSLVDEGAED